MLLETSTLPIHGKYGTVQVEGPRCVVFFEEEFDKSAGLWDCRWETVRLCFTDHLFMWL